jgi:hypothetical protein
MNNTVERDQSLLESFVIAALHKYSLAVIAPRHDMVQNSGSMDARMTGHEREIAELITLGKSDMRTITPIQFDTSPVFLPSVSVYAGYFGYACVTKGYTIPCDF